MQTHHKLLIMAIVFSLILLALGQKCHAMSDFAGQGKAPITWNDLMIPREDPSRVFAVPGGHGNHPAGGYDAPQAVAKADKAETVKPDSKPPMPHIPLVPAPKPKPEVKPEVKPEPEVKEHKCWRFKFHCAPKVKPECKHDRDKPACNADRQAPRSDSCRKPDHTGPGPSNPGKDSSCGKSGDQKGVKGPGVGTHANGHGFGVGRHGHGVGKGAGHGHGKGGCHGK